MPCRQPAQAILRALILVASAWTSAADASDSEIQRVLEAPAHGEIAAAEWNRWKSSVTPLYEQRGFEPLWCAHGTLTAAALGLVQELLAAEKRGLDPDDYAAPRLAKSAHCAGGELAMTDATLTVTAARFVSDIHSGRVDPAALGFAVDATRPQLDVLNVVRSLTVVPAAEVVADVLDAVEPQWRRFALLKRALAQYRSLAAELPPIPIVRPVRWDLAVGGRYAGAPSLRRLLAALGDLPGGATDASDDGVLDARLVAAIAGFQRRHGLRPSGVLDRKTYAVLTVALERRVRQIELALERFRWLPPKLESPPIVVNIPQFKLFAFYTTADLESAILPIDVIVGQAYARFSTPVLAADMTHVIFNPYWDVPFSILSNELLPFIRADSQWIRSKGYEIVWGGGAVTQSVDAATLAALADGRARLRQRPGPDNALGRIKFVLPNRHNIGLHDTPAGELFAEARRAFSHGCIRVADPVALAEYALRESPRWTRARIAEAMRGTAPSRVDLVRPIRVFMIYATALAAEDGTVYFFEDLYGHDARLEKALASRRH